MSKLNEKKRVSRNQAEFLRMLDKRGGRMSYVAAVSREDLSAFIGLRRRGLVADHHGDHGGVRHRHYVELTELGQEALAGLRSGEWQER